MTEIKENELIQQNTRIHFSFMAWEEVDLTICIGVEGVVEITNNYHSQQNMNLWGPIRKLIKVWKLFLRKQSFAKMTENTRK